MSKRCFIVAAAVFSTLTSSVRATFWETENDPALYGHLDQNHESVNFGDQACGPTSVVNSFTFLKNKYGFNGLLDADPYETINTLETYMGTSGDNGTDIADLITGKRDYINDKGLGDKISVEGQTTFNLGIEGIADDTKPTWNFLFDQIEMGQDVEVLINWWDGTKYVGGHYLTVTGMTWEDSTDDGGLSFVDPWDGVDLNGLLSMHNGFMQLSYNGGAATDPDNPDNPDHLATADIVGVVAESPIGVPEPSTLAFLVLGLVTMQRRRRAS